MSDRSPKRETGLEYKTSALARHKMDDRDGRRAGAVRNVETAIAVG
jgi:hypothetical protein